MEMQFLLAYSGIILPISSEDMILTEFFWWFDRLVNQKKEEKRSKDGGVSANDILEENPTLAAKFGFVKNRAIK